MLFLEFLKVLGPSRETSVFPNEPLPGLADLVDQGIARVCLGIIHGVLPPSPL